MKNINFNFYQLLNMKKGTVKYFDECVNSIILASFSPCTKGLTLPQIMKKLKTTDLRACDVRKRLNKLVKIGVLAINGYYGIEPYYWYYI